MHRKILTIENNGNEKTYILSGYKNLGFFFFLFLLGGEMQHVHEILVL